MLDHIAITVADLDRAKRFYVAFRSPDRATVDAFHRAPLEAGGVDNGAPGFRPQYHEHYYAAYVHDASGHNIEAVCNAAD